MRAGFNPVRRNRKIGTARSGYGQDNQLVIPDSQARSRMWTETLGRHRKVIRTVGNETIVFIIEKESPEFKHACSVDDVCRILSYLPPGDWQGITTFVFRQPTRKQWILSPVWGRLFYSADIGSGTSKGTAGPCVMLEAVEMKKPLKWSKSLTLHAQAELEQLRADGHVIETYGNSYRIALSEVSVRATQLYRTLLHEIGHWVDFQTKVEGPNEAGMATYEDLMDAYFSRPPLEREAFANRYAEHARAKLEEAQVIPFSPILDASL